MARMGLAQGGVIVALPFAALGADRGELSAQLATATEQVKAIVNQPVSSYPADASSQPALFHPGWFHDGASTPDFAHVDVRASQECGNYAHWDWVTSDLNPGLMFRGADLEFNANTKLFYNDRTLPKKKLTEDEMVAINGLYRTIGDCLAQVRGLPGTGPAPGTPGGVPQELAAAARPRSASAAGAGEPSPRMGVALASALVLALVLVRVRRRDDRRLARAVVRHASVRGRILAQRGHSRLSPVKGCRKGGQGPRNPAGIPST
jgi:hypothetical protein